MPLEELIGVDGAGAAAGRNVHRRADRSTDGRHFGGGVGMGDAAGHRAAVANGSVPYVGHRRGNQWSVAGDLGRLLRFRVAHHRPEGEASVGVDSDLFQRIDRADVDDMLGTAEPEGHDRQEALPAGQHLGVITVLGKHRKRLVDRRRPVIVEGWVLHASQSVTCGRGETAARSACPFPGLRRSGTRETDRVSSQRTRPTEPRIPALAPADRDDRATALIGGSTMGGDDEDALNIFATMANHSALMKRWMVFANHVLFKSTLPERERELAILRIGWRCGAEYEFGQHTLIGLECGLTEDEIAQVTRPEIGSWNELDALILRATDELHEDACITDDTWAALAEHWNTQQLMDLVFAVGQYNLVSMALNSFGVQLDVGVPGWPE